MRVLVLGAGAVGGYFGGRLLEAGEEVTFLARPPRAQKLAQAGLTITSSFGNAFLPAPACLTASELHALAERGEPAARFDLVILTCKAYDLEQSIADIRPAVGTETLIIPMLNGMRHLQVLDAAFGPRHVLGGKCHISARLNAAGEIVHLSNVHDFVYGERFTEQAERVDVIDPIFSHAKFTAVHSRQILLEMWEKWFFLATLAGINCLMRGTVGDIVQAGGGAYTLQLIEECRLIAERAGYPPRDHVYQDLKHRVLNPKSTLAASLMTDLEAGGANEAAQILYDLKNYPSPVPLGGFSLLDLAITHLRVADIRREREGASSRG